MTLLCAEYEDGLWGRLFFVCVTSAFLKSARVSPVYINKVMRLFFRTVALLGFGVFFRHCASGCVLQFRRFMYLTLFNIKNSSFWAVLGAVFV